MVAQPADPPRAGALLTVRAVGLDRTLRPGTYRPGRNPDSDIVIDSPLAAVFTGLTWWRLTRLGPGRRARSRVR